MKVLWVTNIPLPEFDSIIGEKPLPYGGWLIDSSKKLANQEGIDLTICFPKRGTNSLLKVKGEKMDYYAFKPFKKANIKSNIHLVEKILEETNPDIVNIHGTEMEHSYLFTQVCKEKKIRSIINLQGIVSFIAMHNRANLPEKVYYGNTFRNIIKRDSVYELTKKYSRRGQYEIKALNNSLNVIGRTFWDKSCINAINSEIKYFSCNESLRETFYHAKWDFNNCEKKTLFLSQGFYSIKGLHYILEAMKLILKRHPETKLYIAGNNPISNGTLKEKLVMTKYGKYIHNLINEIEEKNNIIFTGPLSEEQICKMYLNSHVFVCPSSIENSPNSLGEAMILGVPCVASYVGGIPDMLKDKEEGYLYQHDAPYMLANYICEIFENNNVALKFSQNGRKRALLTHDREKNFLKLLEIYRRVLK